MPVAEFAVGICTPTRLSLTAKVKRDLAPYHFKLQGVSVDAQTDDNNKPLYWRVRVGFSDKAANWGEYVMLRLGYHRIPPFFDERNAAWAGQYVYIPEAGNGLYELGCKDKPKPKPQQESAAGRGVAQQQQQARQEVVTMPQRNAPTPWDSKPRDWWNTQASQPAQAQPKKRKRTSFW